MEQVRLSEVVAALSLAADLGNGLPLETTLRICLVATRLSQAAGAGEEDVAATYQTGLLWSAGCTSTAHEETIRFGDDHMKGAMAGADPTRPPEFFRRAWGFGGAGGVAAMLRHGRAHGLDIAAYHCEAGARLAGQLGFEKKALEGLGAFFELWNGGGGPQGRQGEAIPFAARAVRTAYVAVHALRAGSDPVQTVGARAGGELDPALVATFERYAGELLAGVEAESVWDETLAAEPEPRPWAPASRLDGFAAAFGDFVDLKSVFWLGHSAAVAALAERAGQAAGAAGLAELRMAARVHGLGRVAVSNRIWDKAAPLSAAEWERVRLYPYFTDRVIGRASALAEVTRTASGVQERLDGSGYHRGLPATAQPLPMRLLAAAAAYQALVEDRPQRRALAPLAAAEQLRSEAAAGRLDGDAVRAVLEAAGHRPRRGAWPAGLTDREVDVLRAVARGATAKQVAAELHISTETARNHVKHIYDKAEVSTRAGAALFAMENGLFLVE
jgi:HD-GYP domain-containing protein (c-di-GMP phosphodiesterase class II)